MTVREMIEELKHLPQDMTVVTHSAGLTGWMESNGPFEILMTDDGRQTVAEYATKRVVAIV